MIQMPYYHAIIGLKNRPDEDALATDLSEKELKDRIVRPISERRKFVAHDELVYPEQIESIKITKTDKPLHEIIGGSFVPSYTDYWEAANSGQVVTADYITEAEREIKKSSVEALSRSVFIVHGRDHKPMKELKGILSELGFNPIVLHEQPSGSRTIVEKLEKYSDVGYAFVILTPDDVGGSSEDRSTLRFDGKARARQNVVLEFGYFIGRVGRDRVCCLYKGNVELPSDMHGIVYIPFRESINEVREKIIKELREAGHKIEV